MSNKQHLAEENGENGENGERMKFRRVYGDGDGDGRMYMNLEEGKDNYNQKKYLNRREGNLGRERGYYIQKHERPDGGIVNGEIPNPTTVYLNTKKTQTPVREVSNEGIQYNKKDTRHPLTQFANRLKQRMSADVEVGSEEKLPFSTIQK